VANRLPVSESDPDGTSFSDRDVFQACMGGSEGPHAVGEGPCNPTTLLCKNSTTEGTTGPIACPTNNAGSDQLCEFSDAGCFPKGTRVVMLDGKARKEHQPVAGCLENFFQNGDLDFDGTPYWKEWPTGLTPTIYPSSFLDQFPSTNGRQYPQFFFQTDIALSEATCLGNTQPGQGGTLAGCTVPPPGPGGFYPYWTQRQAGRGSCALEFGNVSHGFGLNDFGKDTEYGTNMYPTLGYPEFEGPVHNNTCARLSSF
jgi:hypothetical protein